MKFKLYEKRTKVQIEGHKPIYLDNWSVFNKYDTDQSNKQSPKQICSKTDCGTKIDVQKNESKIGSPKNNSG